MSSIFKLRLSKWNEFFKIYTHVRIEQMRCLWTDKVMYFDLGHASAFISYSSCSLDHVQNAAIQIAGDRTCQSVNTKTSTQQVTVGKHDHVLSPAQV